MTTGKGFNIYSGSAMNQSVFSVDEEGSIQSHKSDGTSRYYHEYHLSASQADPGASGASPTELGAVFSYLLNATTEYLYYAVDIHDDWDGASDVEVEVEVYLPNAETAEDLIRMSVLCEYGADHDNANALKTQTLTADHDILNDNAQFDIHKIPFTLNWDEGGNVLEVGDTLHFRVYLDDVTTAPVVPAVNVKFFNAKYKTDKPQLEA